MKHINFLKIGNYLKFGFILVFSFVLSFFSADIAKYVLIVGYVVLTLFEIVSYYQKPNSEKKKVRLIATIIIGTILCILICYVLNQM